MDARDSDAGQHISPLSLQRFQSVEFKRRRVWTIAWLWMWGGATVRGTSALVSEVGALGRAGASSHCPFSLLISAPQCHLTGAGKSSTFLFFSSLFFSPFCFPFL